MSCRPLNVSFLVGAPLGWRPHGPNMPPPESRAPSEIFSWLRACIDRDVLNVTIPDFNTLDYTLTFPGQSLVSPNSGSRIWLKIPKNPTNGIPDSCDITSYLASHWSDFSGYCVISWNLNLVKPGSGQKKFLGRSSFFLQITFELRKIEKQCKTPSYSSHQDASKPMHFDPERSIWKFDLSSSQMTWPDKWPR